MMIFTLCADVDGDRAKIGAEIYEDINVIASILKLYFRLLPIPLITFDAHPELLKSVRKYWLAYVI